jgi:type IV secretion system protein TrbE
MQFSMIFPAELPNGFFFPKLIWYTTPSTKRAYVTRGYRLSVLDSVAGSTAAKNGLTQAFAECLANVPADHHLQVPWEVNGEYFQELGGYRQRTEHYRKHGTHVSEAVLFAREFRYLRNLEAAQKGQLRRQHLHVYLTKPLDVGFKGFRSARGVQHEFEAILVREEHASEHFGTSLQATLGAYVQVDPLDALGHYRHFRRVLNPSLPHASDEDLTKEFDPELTIQQLCYRSSVQEHGGFYLQDGFYHTALLVDRWAPNNPAGNAAHLTELPINNYSLTCNVYPIDEQAFIDQKDAQAQRVAGDASASRKISLSYAAKNIEAQIAEASANLTRPLNALYVARVWDRSLDGLLSAVETVKAGFHKAGLQVQQPSMFSTLRNVIFQTLPGATFSKYRGYDKFANNLLLACNLPLSSSFVGDLYDAEALYEGPGKSLIGVKTFRGRQPAMSASVGPMGTGKSSQLFDLALQTEIYYAGAGGRTYIVESGKSFEVYPKFFGCRTITLQPDGEQRLNYLDTFGNPLSHAQVSAASTLLLKLTGGAESAEEAKLRSAWFGQYVRKLYEHQAKDWERQHAEEMPNLMRHAYAVERLLQRLHVDDGESTFLDAWTDLRDRLEGVHSCDEVQSWIAAPDEGQVVAWSKTALGRSRVIDVIVSRFRPEEYPRHTSLVQYMRGGVLPHHPKDLIHRLTDLLEVWCARSGQRGQLFDGVTNLDFSAPIVHLELSRLTESSADLKEAAPFLIATTITQHIMGMRRSVRKRILFDETKELLKIRGADDAMGSAFATYRKYNCWLALTLQNYSQLDHNPALKDVIRGATKTFFLFRQTADNDRAVLSKSLDLPDATVRALATFPETETLKEGAHSSFLYHVNTPPHPVSGVTQYHPAELIKLASATDGDLYEQRKAAFREAAERGETDAFQTLLRLCETGLPELGANGRTVPKGDETLTT